MNQNYKLIFYTKKVTLIILSLFLANPSFSYDIDQQKLEQLESWVENGGLEVISAKRSMKKLESFWGHTSLRFVNSHPSQLQDIVLDIQHKHSTSEITLKKYYNAISGHNDILLSLKHLSEQLLPYYFPIIRGYNRTIILTNRQMRKNLLDTLKQEIKREHKDKYKFTSNNCASFMIDLLSRASFNFQPILPYFSPGDMNKFLKKSFLSPWPEIKGLNKKNLDKTVNTLKKTDLKQVSTLSLQRLLVFQGNQLKDKRADILNEIRNREDLDLGAKVYYINKLPIEFYQLKGINHNFHIKLNQLFSKKNLKKSQILNKASWNTIGLRAKFCQKTKEVCEYFKSAIEQTEKAIKGI